MKAISAEIFEKEKHSALVEGWFSAWGQEPPPWDNVPPNGFVILNNGIPVCCGFLCNTDMSIAIIVNYISDKFCDKEIRSDCVDYLCVKLDSLALSLNYKMICISTAQPKMARRFEKMGYTTTHEKFINLGRILCLGSQ